MLVPKVTVFLALSTDPGLFNNLPEEPPPPFLLPFLGGVRKVPGGGIDASGEAVSAGDVGEAAPSREDRFFFFFFFFLSDDDSGVATCAGRTGPGNGEGAEGGHAGKDGHSI